MRRKKMAGDSWRTATADVGENSSEKERIDEGMVEVADGSVSESKIANLRGRWELASVLNFLSVFEQVIGRDLKLTAEEIEAGLVMPNKSLAQLHITLLKGIPPVSKALNSSGAWVTVLCKKLAPWWPWVAEGEIPLTVAKGEEVVKYKELDPTNRLLILKALCEVRAEQEDAVSYINAALKDGTEVSCFRKDKIGGDGNATSYWYDGNTVIGLRLYKETNETVSRTKMKSKPCTDMPALCSQWETLATNLGEFQRVVDDLSSSKIVAEVALGKTIHAEVLPAIEKFQKKKERALKQKQRQEKLLNDIKSFGTWASRSCRNHGPISYTFDEYDRAMAEAIEVTKKRKTIEEQRKERKHIKQGEISSNGCFDISKDYKGSYGNIRNGYLEIEAHLDTEAKGDRLEAAANDDDYESKRDDNNGMANRFSHSDDSFSHESLDHTRKPVGDHLIGRPATLASHLAVETRNLVTKKMSRQRPISNSALDSIVPGSEDGNL